MPAQGKEWRAIGRSPKDWYVETYDNSRYSGTSLEDVLKNWESIRSPGYAAGGGVGKSMNLLQVQNDLKSLSDEQLANQMKQPNGAIPPFMAMMEAKRRQDMRKGSGAPGTPQSTVGDEINQKQQQAGLTDVMRRQSALLTPPQDQQPSGYAGGGPVVAFQGGGSPYPAGSYMDRQWRIFNPSATGPSAPQPAPGQPRPWMSLPPSAPGQIGDPVGVPGENLTPESAIPGGSPWWRYAPRVDPQTGRFLWNQPLGVPRSEPVPLPMHEQPNPYYDPTAASPPPSPEPGGALDPKDYPLGVPRGTPASPRPGGVPGAHQGPSGPMGPGGPGGGGYRVSASTSGAPAASGGDDFENFRRIMAENKGMFGEPGYYDEMNKKIKDLVGDPAKMKQDAASEGLLMAGLGILSQPGNKNPWVPIGKGAMVGYETYKDARKEANDRAFKDMSLSLAVRSAKVSETQGEANLSMGIADRILKRELSAEENRTRLQAAAISAGGGRAPTPYEETERVAREIARENPNMDPKDVRSEAERRISMSRRTHAAVSPYEQERIRQGDEKLAFDDYKLWAESREAMDKSDAYKAARREKFRTDRGLPPSRSAADPLGANK